MARRARCRHPRRGGAREPAAHVSREGAGGTLRDSPAADGQSRGRTGGQGESTPGTHGLRMEVKPGYKQSDVGVIPADWEVKSIAQIAPLQRGFDLPTTLLKDGPYPVVYSNGVM